LRKAEDVILRHGVHSALDLSGRHAAAGGDELAANVLGNGGGAIEGEKKGSFELGLGALNFGLGDVLRQARPFPKGKVDKIVNAGVLVGDEIDTPETIPC
jgi:hypothetical protein